MSVFRGASVGTTLTADKSKYSRELRAAKAELRGWQRDVERGTKRAGAAFRTFGRYSAIGLGVITAAAIKVGSDFDKEMSKVQALSGATGKGFQQLRDEAIKLGARTSFSAREAAQGMSVLGAAGFNTKQTLAAVGGVLDAAAASGESMQEVASILTSTMNGFNLTAKDSAHIADVLAKSANESDASIGDLGQSMKFVAPVAATANQSLEDVAAALTVLANNGIKADTAGTALRAGLLRLAAPTKPARDAIKELNVSLFDTHGKMKPLPALVGEFSKAFKDLTQKEKLENLKKIFGMEAAPAWIKLIDEGAPALKRLSGEMKHADGEARKMGDTMRNNVAGAADQAKGAAETLAIVLNDLIKAPLRDMLISSADAMGNLATTIQTWARTDEGRATMRDFSGYVQTAGHALVTLGGAVGSTIGFLVRHRDATIAAGAALVTYTATMKAAAIMGPLVSGLNLAIAGMVQFMAATKGARLSMASLQLAFASTPWGLVATGVAAAVGALVYFSQKSHGTETQADRTARAIRGIGGAIAGLNDKSLAFDEAKLNKKFALAALDAANARLKKAKQGTQEYRDAVLGVEQAELGLKRANQDSARARKEYNDAAGKTKGHIKDLREEVARETEIIGTNKQKLASLRDEIIKYGNHSATTADLQGRLKREIKESEDRLRDARTEIRKQPKPTKDMSDSVLAAAQAFRDLDRDIGKVVERGRTLPGAASFATDFAGTQRRRASARGDGSIYDMLTPEPFAPVPPGVDRDVGRAVGLGQSMGLSVGSMLRPGAVTSTGQPSDHASGHAVDMSGSEPQMRAFAIAANRLRGVKQVIHSTIGWARDGGPFSPIPPSAGTVLRDHYNHTHVAMYQRGGVVGGVGSGDHVPALLEPGEGIVNRRAVAAMGGGATIHAINSAVPRFKGGGVVPGVGFVNQRNPRAPGRPVPMFPPRPNDRAATLAAARRRAAIAADLDRQLRRANTSLTSSVKDERSVDHRIAANNDRIAQIRKAIKGGHLSDEQEKKLRKELEKRTATAAQLRDRDKELNQRQAELADTIVDLQKQIADAIHEEQLARPQTMMQLIDAQRDLQRARAEGTATVADDIQAAIEAMSDEAKRQEAIQETLANDAKTDEEKATLTSQLAASIRTQNQLAKDLEELRKTGSTETVIDPITGEETQVSGTSLADLAEQLKSLAESMQEAFKSETGNVFRRIHVDRFEQTFTQPVAPNAALEAFQFRLQQAG